MALSLVEEIVRLARWQVIFYALEVIIEKIKEVQADQIQGEGFRL